MFELQSPSKYSPLDAIHLVRLFKNCLKTVKTVLSSGKNVSLGALHGEYFEGD